MLITDITAEMLPLFLVEIRVIPLESERWMTFTVEPFVSKAEAQRHIEKMLADPMCKNLSPDHLRVSSYTAHRWHFDLIEAVMASDEITRDVLRRLPSETLVWALRNGHDAEPEQP